MDSRGEGEKGILTGVRSSKSPHLPLLREISEILKEKNGGKRS
jgi:hypothetical protein